VRVVETIRMGISISVQAMGFLSAPFQLGLIDPDVSLKTRSETPAELLDHGCGYRP
jgi:hypothetical protein